MGPSHSEIVGASVGALDAGATVNLAVKYLYFMNHAKAPTCFSSSQYGRDTDGPGGDALLCYIILNVASL